MNIVIDYESSWRNSFLDGDNNQPLPRRGRKFTASIRELKKIDNFQRRDITIDTVMGVLCRLIGDQRKLYQSRTGQAEGYYFRDIEPKVSFIDKPTIINHELIYLRNMKGSTDQHSFTGMIKVNDPIFCSDYSQALWSVLGLGLDELCEFILTGKVFENRVLLDPIAILKHFEVLKKQKPLMYTGTMKVASDYLSSCYTKYSPFNAKGELLPLPMYCSALYLQLKRLSHKYDVSSALSKRGGISGISNNGVTPKDFMDRFTTGSKKLIYGNPYVYEQFVKGEGKVKHLLNKACGQLEIQLAISLDKAKELHKMIENAGVSTFYLGKKGLAYVSAIEI